MEDKSKLYSINVKSNVTCLFWTQEKLKEASSKSGLTSEVEEPNSHMKFWVSMMYINITITY